jgi:hypothetical protein
LFLENNIAHLKLDANPLLSAKKNYDERIFRRKSSRRDTMHALHIANAAKRLEKLPEENESIHAIMRGNFHGWDLVPATMQLAGCGIEKLYVATLGFNARNTAELLKFIDAGRIGFCRFLCSCYFKDASAAEFESLRQGLSDRGMQIVAARTHAKILAMRLMDGRSIVVESSANLRSCRNIEQFCMTNSGELFKFHAA